MIEKNLDLHEMTFKIPFDKLLREKKVVELIKERGLKTEKKKHTVHFLEIKDLDQYEGWPSSIFSMYEAFF